MTRLPKSRATVPIVCGALLLLGISPGNVGAASSRPTALEAVRLASITPLMEICKRARMTISNNGKSPPQRLPAILALELRIQDALKRPAGHLPAKTLRHLRSDASLAIAHTERTIKSVALANKTQSMSLTGSAVIGSLQAVKEAARLTAEVCRSS